MDEKPERQKFMNLPDEVCVPIFENFGVDKVTRSLMRVNKHAYEVGVFVVNREMEKVNQTFTERMAVANAEPQDKQNAAIKGVYELTLREAVSGGYLPLLWKKDDSPESAAFNKGLSEGVAAIAGDYSDNDVRIKLPSCLYGAQLQGLEADYVRLPYADLQGANLRGLNRLHIDFENANLQKSDLREADLRDTSLKKVDLRGADLRGTKLPPASMLQGAKFEGALIDKTTVLSGNKLDGAIFIENKKKGPAIGDIIDASKKFMQRAAEIKHAPPIKNEQGVIVVTKARLMTKLYEQTVQEAVDGGYLRFLRRTEDTPENRKFNQDLSRTISRMLDDSTYDAEFKDKLKESLGSAEQNNALPQKEAEKRGESSVNDTPSLSGRFPLKQEVEQKEQGIQSDNESQVSPGVKR